MGLVKINSIMSPVFEANFKILYHRSFVDVDEVAFFNAKRWDRRNRADLIESATPCHDTNVLGSYQLSNPHHLTVLTALHHCARHNTFKF